MTGTDVANIIMQVSTLVTAITSAIVSLRNSRKIEQVHLATNSMKDQLVAATKEAAERGGALKEKQDEQTRKDITAAAIASVPVPAAGALEMKIINTPSEPVPTILTDVEQAEERERQTHKLPPFQP